MKRKDFLKQTLGMLAFIVTAVMGAFTEVWARITMVHVSDTDNPIRFEMVRNKLLNYLKADLKYAKKMLKKCQSGPWIECFPEYTWAPKPPKPEELGWYRSRAEAWKAYDDEVDRYHRNSWVDAEGVRRSRSSRTEMYLLQIAEYEARINEVQKATTWREMTAAMETYLDNNGLDDPEEIDMASVGLLDVMFPDNEYYA